MQETEKQDITIQDNEKHPENSQKITNNTQKESSPDIKTEENKENWRRFREDREKQRKAKEEAEKIAAQKHAEAEALKAAMESLLNKNTSSYDVNIKSEYTDEENEKKYIQSIVQAAIDEERKKYKEEQAQYEIKILPQRLNQSHPDFEQVCSEENIDYFEYHHPEIAIGYKHMPDGYEKWSALYRAIKKYVPIQDKKRDSEKIERNTLKPQAHTPNITDNKPQTSGWKLTEERRKANWERMQRDMKFIG